MVQYLLYQRRNLSTPFLVLNEDVVDSTTTAVYFVGKRTEAYGQPEQQSKLWILENFANSTQPAPAILGQAWFNTIDGQLYVCVNQTSQLFEKVSTPIAAPVAPVNNLSDGDLWYNTSTLQLFAFNGASWELIGPISTVPTTAQAVNYFNVVTSDGGSYEMWLNGTTNSRLIIDPNQSWLFEIDLIARVVETNSEVVAMSFKGVLDRPNIGNTNIPGGVQNNIFNITSSLASTVGAVVTANVTYNSLLITVTGQISKTIIWNAIVTTTMVSN